MGNFLLLMFGLFLALIGIFSSSGRLLCFFVILESLNVLLVGYNALEGGFGFFIAFVAVLVMFTVEVIVALVILTRIWGSGGLTGSSGW